MRKSSGQWLEKMVKDLVSEMDAQSKEIQQFKQN